jgi:hypothetical protein
VEFLNYHHLRYFWVVAKEGGLRRAAEKLRVSQPTISAQIAALGGYSKGATTMRGQGYDAMKLSQAQADAQARAELAQRGLNQAGMIDYENMGFDTRKQQMENELRQQAIAAKENQTAADAKEAKDARNRGIINAGVSMVGSIFSDDRTKVLEAERKAYLLGRAHETEGKATGKPVAFAYGGPPKKGEDIVDTDPRKAGQGLRPMAAQPKAGVVSMMRAPKGRTETPNEDEGGARMVEGAVRQTVPFIAGGPISSLYGGYQLVDGAEQRAGVPVEQGMFTAPAGPSPDMRATIPAISVSLSPAMPPNSTSNPADSIASRMAAKFVSSISPASSSLPVLITATRRAA